MKSGVSSYLIYSDLDAFINFFRVSPQASAGSIWACGADITQAQALRPGGRAAHATETLGRYTLAS